MNPIKIQLKLIWLTLEGYGTSMHTLVNTQVKTTQENAQPGTCWLIHLMIQSLHKSLMCSIISKIKLLTLPSLEDMLWFVELIDQQLRNNANISQRLKMMLFQKISKLFKVISSAI